MTSTNIFSNTTSRVCYFGDFNPDYSRNRVIIKGLKENGVEVLFCHTTLRGLEGLWDLFKKHNHLKNKYDILIVGYSDPRFMVPLAKLISRRKIVWDAFYSLYDSWVFDRKLVPTKSLKAKYYWSLDWFSCKLADLILLDTDAHIDYFSKTFGIKNSKFIKIFVGTADNIFYPKPVQETSDKFLVHFHGNFIPLQGMEYIIKAAGLLSDYDIQFQVIGQGQEYGRIKKIAAELNLKNITWINRVAYQELPYYMSKADVCLGVFGDTPKVQQVIPNKVYEAIAMQKPVISGDSTAIRELFTDRVNILLCSVADSEDLAAKILELHTDLHLKNSIAQKGYELFREAATPQKTVQELVRNLVDHEENKAKI